MADIDEVEGMSDPVERAREVGRRMALIPVVHARLAAIRRQAVLEMRDRGMSLADIGRELGLHRNRVQQIAEGRSSGGQGGKVEPGQSLAPIVGHDRVTGVPLCEHSDDAAACQLAHRQPEA